MSDNDEARADVTIDEMGIVGSKARPIRVTIGRPITIRYDSHASRSEGGEYPRYALSAIRGDSLVQVTKPTAPSKPEGPYGTRYRTVSFEARATGVSHIDFEFSRGGTTTFSFEVMTAEELTARARREGPTVLRFGGNFSDVLTASEQVITDESTWEDVWERVHAKKSPRPALPIVDFTKQAVIAVFLGKHASGGYTIQISRIRDTGRRVEVEVDRFSPTRSNSVIEVDTSPYDIVVIPKPTKPVVFKSESARR
jgi:hypothetical protein